VGAGSAFGAATGGGIDAATQGLSIATGVQEGYDLNRTRNATLMGGAVGFGAAGAGHLVQTRQQASALSAEAAARRVVRTPSDGAEQSAVQQARPLTVVEDGGSARFGETASTRIGREVHAGEAAWRRESRMLDVVNAPITDMAGVPILAPKLVDLRTG
jgi:hypothetical protein